jgi:hypothetical protein
MALSPVKALFHAHTICPSVFKCLRGKKKAIPVTSSAYLVHLKTAKE